MTVTVSECWIYPLKSAKGISLDGIELTHAGLRHDREWVLIHESSEYRGRFISQRDKGCEKLARVDALPNGEASTTFLLPDGTRLTVNHDGLNPYSAHANIWDDLCEVVDAGNDASQIFSDYLEINCRLVRMRPGFVRQTDLKYSKHPHPLGFADGFPILITNRASLDALAQHMKAPQTLHMQRFRPNIVLEGLDAFEEDIIHQISIGEVILELVKPCARCKIINVDQAHGLASDNEALLTLTRTRKGKSEDLSGAFFGQNAVILKGGTVKVGQNVKLLSKKAQHPALNTSPLRYNM